MGRDMTKKKYYEVTLHSRVSPETQRMIDQISELRRSPSRLEKLPLPVRDFIKAPNVVTDLLTIEADSSTAGTLDPVFFFEPTDRFLMLITALQTNNFDSFIVDIGHS